MKRRAVGSSSGTTRRGPYPASADEEGDPVTLAEASTTTFSHRRKVFKGDADRLERIETDIRAMRDLMLIAFQRSRTGRTGRTD